MVHLVILYIRINWLFVVYENVLQIFAIVGVYVYCIHSVEVKYYLYVNFIAAIIWYHIVRIGHSIIYKGNHNKLNLKSHSILMYEKSFTCLIVLCKINRIFVIVFTSISRQSCSMCDDWKQKKKMIVFDLVFCLINHQVTCFAFLRFKPSLSGWVNSILGYILILSKIEHFNSNCKKWKRLKW